MNNSSPNQGQKIAVIGSGIAGLSAAWLLSRAHDVRLFEAAPRLGGHSNTVTTPAGDAVDTGFIVFNRVTYPNLCALFTYLGVESHDTDMSFGVSLERGRLEYCSNGLNGMFGQRRNLARPRFHRMLGDLVRFYRQAPIDLTRGYLTDLSLGDYLALDGYSEHFARAHILPMGAAIWSSSVEAMMAFPATSFVRFYVNHGLFRLKDQPIWRSVTGGSQRYVEKLSAGLRQAERISLGDAVTSVREQSGRLRLHTASGIEFLADQVVFACHSDQALQLLDGALAHGRREAVLQRLRYQPNRAVLHTDASLMPRRKRTWASWNYMSETQADGSIRASVSYWMNLLQGIPKERPYFVSLNPIREPDPASVISSQDYAHPVFDADAIAAQQEISDIQGIGGLWFCGAWCGYGFHEDGLASGLTVAEAIGGVRRPWHVPEASPAAVNAQPLPIELRVAAQ